MSTKVFPDETNIRMARWEGRLPFPKDWAFAKPLWA